MLNTTVCATIVTVARVESAEKPFVPSACPAVQEEYSALASRRNWKPVPAGSRLAPPAPGADSGGYAPVFSSPRRCSSQTSWATRPLLSPVASAMRS